MKFTEKQLRELMQALYDPYKEIIISPSGEYRIIALPWWRRVISWLMVKLGC